MNHFPINSKFFKKSILLIFLMLPFIQFAQTEIQKDSVEVIPQAIEISEIARQSEETRVLIENNQTLTNNKSKVKSINKGLIDLDSAMVTNLVLLRDTLTYFNLDQLDKLEDRITVYNNRVDVWKKTISEWKEQTTENEKRIEFDTALWRLTSDTINAREKNTIDIDSSRLETVNRIKEQVVSNITILETVKDELNVWEEELEALEATVAVSKGEINEAFSLISQKKTKSIDNIWTPEYNPIWDLSSDKKSEVASISFKEQYGLKKMAMKQFVSDNNEIYYQLVFIFMLVFSIILFLNIKAKKLFSTNPSALDKGSVVLKYPFWSTMIILSFVISLFFDIPIELKYIVLSFLIIPFSVLIWERKSENRVYDILFFITFCLIIIALPIISEYHIMLRYALFVINLVLFGLLIYLKTRKDLVRKENTYWLGTLPFLINVFIVISIIAFVTNSIGSVQLSFLLTRTTLGTLIAFVIIKEAVLLVQSFLYLLLMGPLFSISNILKNDGDEVLNRINTVLKYIAYLFWFYIIFGLLKIRKSFVTAILDFINTPLEIGELSISLGNVLAFFIIFQISIWISKFIRYFLDKEIYPRTKISLGAASTFSIMIKYTLIVFGFMLALASAGVKYSNIAIGLGALGVGIGFGLQNIVANFISGIILALERPIKIGDIVKVGDVEGEVKDIGMRASQIRSWEGADVFIPNGSLISGNLANKTYKDRQRRLDLEVRLALGSDIPAASQVVLDAANTVPELFNPFINFIGVKEGAAVLNVYGWVNDYSQGMAVGTLFRAAVYQALINGGFELPVPLLNVTINEKGNKSTDKTQGNKKI